MYVTYFSLFSNIQTANVLYSLLYNYTVILKLHVLNFTLLPTSSYSAGVLPNSFSFTYFVPSIYIFTSSAYACTKIPFHQLLVHSHFKVWPLLSHFCISLPPDHLPIPSTTLRCSFFPAFFYVHQSVRLFPNCCKESATFAFILFAIFCIFYLLPSPNCLMLSYTFTHTE